MIKKQHLSIMEETKPSILYLDDIKYFIELAQENTNKFQIQLTGEHEIYKLNSLEDLDELKNINIDKFNNFKFESSDPYFTLELYNSNGRIYISENTPLLRGILEKVKDRLHLRKRFLSLFIVTSNWLPPSIAIVILTMTNYKENYIALSSLILLGVWFVYGFYIQFKEFNIIYIKHKKDMPSFLTRNKDKIFVGIILAIVTTIFSFFLQK